ncbi:O-antigen ligase family protein [Xanthomarina spongicola]|uniref:O-antigen ligase n=1 Tax=Xanthomarina spongicola TaxID=570520 RepID=A0A316EAL7_9FLAO|nr:O-antigen ligase family protein [Xanthomarina spongicola]PWK19960.1 O-antigen ligase [Xanthomarina spongicola]
MKLLKYFLLTLILLNMTSFSLTVLGSGGGSLFSALLFGCIILFYFLNPKPKIQIIFVVLGLTYFFISGINYTGPIRDFFIDVIKYFIFIIGAVSLAKETNQKEIGWFMFIGAMSVLINAVVFSSAYGRYGGFYINPNRAGVACLIAFSLTFYLKNKYYKLFLQLLIVIAGIMTLSRTFIVVLLAINIIAIIANKKNSISLVAGSVAIVLVLTVSSLFNLNTVRFSAFQSIFDSQEVETKTITRGSRNETWALYTDIILNNAVTGIGYNALHGNRSNVDIKSGVHNTFLMAIGESGIIPFLLFIILYLALFFRSLRHLKTNPEYTCIATILISFLLVSHNYFDNYLILFISIWLYDKVKSKTKFEISEIPVNL